MGSLPPAENKYAVNALLDNARGGGGLNAYQRPELGAETAKVDRP